MQRSSRGFTMVEFMVTIVLFAIVATTVLTFVISFANLAATSKIRAAATSIASSEIEELRSLPYDQLAVEGGAIMTNVPKLPAVKEVVYGTRTYIVKKDIVYADDAYDGCLAYAAASASLCRNGPVNPSLPIDTNPKDYKSATVQVFDKLSNKQYASLSTLFTARVAETGSNTAALVIQVIDGAGSPVGGATVTIRNTALSPTVEQTISTDANGTALFLDVPPDSDPHYKVLVSKAGYSSLETIENDGERIATYPMVTALSQQASNVTLKIDPISPNSLKIQIVTPSGSPLPNASFSLRGGYKLYTSSDDYDYSYMQTLTTNASGELTIGSLVPGAYIACSPTNQDCGNGNLLAALHVAVGGVSYQPFSIPAGTTTATNGYMQTVRLVMTSSASFPRVTSVSPATVATSSSDISTTLVKVKGAHLDGATVQLKKGSTILTGTTTLESDTSELISREFNMSSAEIGAYDVIVVKGSEQVVQTTVDPGTNGGINVTP